MDFSPPKSVCRTPAQEMPSRIVPQDLFNCAQPSRHSEAVAAVVQGTCLLLLLASNLAIVHLMLVFPACRMQELKTFMQISKEGLGRQARGS